MKFKDGKKMSVLILVAISVILAVIGQLALKKGMTQVGETGVNELLTRKFITIFSNPFVLIGVFFYGLGSLVWLVILSRAELSFAYPLLSTGYILIAVLSWVFFKEQLTMIKMSGIVLITVGVILLLSRL